MAKGEDIQPKKIITTNLNSNSANCRRTNPSRRTGSKRCLKQTIYKDKDYFAMAVSMAKEIMSYPLLKQAWIRAEGDEGEGSRRLINDNLYYLINDKGFNENNILTPGGRDMELYSAFIDNNKFYLTYSSNEFSDSFFPAVLYVFFCFNRLDGLIHSFTEIYNSSNENHIATDEGYKLYNPILKVPAAIHKVLESDPHPMVYAALTSLTPLDKDIFWSETGSVIFNEQDGPNLIMQEEED